MTMRRHPWLFRLSLLSSLLALVVVVLGAYVRLSHAGLGCPDWPGCYGHIDVPQTDDEVQRANTAYPERPLETAKAWKEMTHRYFAATLGLLILTIAVIAWIRRSRGAAAGLPTVLLVLVIFQAALGMWTVTLLLKPLVVTAHLLGGMATLALLWWLMLCYSNWQPPPLGIAEALPGLRRLALLCLAALAVQIALGGWTSTNYAALACYGFPQCNQQWWPSMDFSEAFVLWRGLGIDYEGGVLDHPARVAIHMTHRIGALLVLALLTMLVIRLWRQAAAPVFKGLSLLLSLVLLVQIGLGVANVTKGLPLPIATAHNAGAAILLLTLLSVIYTLKVNRDYHVLPK
ncbi:MAG TPA: COX15/CtaA family protein [Gammaproteobacteria bacterium]